MPLSDGDKDGVEGPPHLVEEILLRRRVASSKKDTVGEERGWGPEESGFSLNSAEFRIRFKCHSYDANIS